jgi:hypothetical protein
MADEHSIARYRRWYRTLLRFYARPHRERFAEGMEQTFNDLCRERAAASKPLLGFVLRTFAETTAGILRQNAATIMTHNLTKRLVAWAAGVALILMAPLLAMQFHWQVPDPGSPALEEVNWTLADFIFAGVLLFGAALTFELVASKGGTTVYRAAVAIACAAGLLLVWINAAVGIIGDGPVNLLYIGVLAVGFLGAIIARFQSHGMSRALFATAIAQMLVPMIALVIWNAGGQNLLIDPNSPHPPFSPGIVKVFVLNGFFAALWLASALLFRHAADRATKVPTDEQGRGTNRQASNR